MVRKHHACIFKYTMGGSLSVRKTAKEVEENDPDVKALDFSNTTLGDADVRRLAEAVRNNSFDDALRRRA